MPVLYYIDIDTPTHQPQIKNPTDISLPPLTGTSEAVI